MKKTMTVVALCALILVAAGCMNVRYTENRVVHGHGSDLSVENALQAVKIETTMDAQGRHAETEFHIRPDEVPEAVHKAMEAKHPGGKYIGAEKEYNNGQLYYELAKEIDGFEAEAMFLPDGTPHDSEVQVPVTKVPQGVQDSIQKGYPNGTVNAWEEIRDGKDVLVEYHVKLTDGDRNYKVAVSPAGKLTAAWREIPAEIEVPVKLP